MMLVLRKNVLQELEDLRTNHERFLESFKLMPNKVLAGQLREQLNVEDLNEKIESFSNASLYFSCNFSIIKS